MYANRNIWDVDAPPSLFLPPLVCTCVRFRRGGLLVDRRMAAPDRVCLGLRVLRVPCWSRGAGLVVGQIAAVLVTGCDR